MILLKALNIFKITLNSIEKQKIAYECTRQSFALDFPIVSSESSREVGTSTSDPLFLLFRTY